MRNAAALVRRRTSDTMSTTKGCQVKAFHFLCGSFASLRLCVKRVSMQGFVEEELHFVEKLQAILFHDDRVGAFADFHVALRRRVLQ